MARIGTIIIYVLFCASVGFNIYQLSASHKTPDKVDSADNPVLIQVGDRVLRAKELRRLDAKVSQAEQQLYEAQVAALEHWAAQQVVMLEAQKRGLSVDALIGTVSKRFSPTVTDEEVDAVVKKLGKIYKDPANPKEPTFVPKATAKQYLMQMKQQQSLQAWLEDIKKKHKITVFVKRPEVPRIDKNLALTDRPSWGNPAAKVKLVSFSDFQCGYCARFAKTLGQLKKEYREDQLFIVFRDFPLNRHTHAVLAARAAKCAARQGKFWEYHDKLFKNQQELERENLVAYATVLGLKKTGFVDCLDNNEEVRKQVEADRQEAMEQKFRGTPTVIVNGEPIQGALDLSSLKKKIDGYLK